MVTCPLGNESKVLLKFILNNKLKLFIPKYSLHLNKLSFGLFLFIICLKIKLTINSSIKYLNITNLSGM